jgi:glycolate oxidase subunit GlcD
MPMLKEQMLQALKDLLPTLQVYCDYASLISYEVDAGLDGGLPEAVVFPRSRDDVVRIARWAAEHAVPLIARGAGTGLSGGAVAERGGIIVAFAHMQHILDIDAYGRSAVVEPAVINLTLDEQARARNLYFPPDPASQRASTIGGNVAENSGGPHCFKYGVTSTYVTGMRVVLAGGRVAQVGGRALDYPAYDLCGLITGSEGTLALIASIDLRLVRTPPAVKTMLAVFDTVEQAGVAVSAIIAAGHVPATMEMMDQKIMRIVEAYVHAGLPIASQALLIIEVDGYPASLEDQVAEVADILRAHEAHGLRIAASAEEREQIWFARKSAAGAVTRLAPSYYTVDITVPRSRLAETLQQVNQVCERYRLAVGYVFHAGDGNLHPMVLIPDKDDAELMARVHRAGREMVELAVSKGGSISGEHGVGIEKREFMPLMYSAAELSAMLDVKHAFDPRCLLNPGKIFPRVETGPEGSSTEPAPADVGPATPATSEEAVAILLAAGRQRRRVHFSAAPAVHAGDVCVLSTSALRGITTYAPDDLYVTVGAGTPVSDLQAFLAGVGKQVPIASPWPEASIGGLVACNVNAPLRMRYGALRDLLLSASVVLPDGRVISTGRPVIKNVAGFDLTKVFVGSHGTLGLITDVTLKLIVPPRAQRTLQLSLDDARSGLLLARQLLPLTLVASALLLRKESWAQYSLVYTAEGHPADVRAELEQVRQICRAAGAAAPLEIESSGTRLWADFLRRAPLSVRVGVAPRDLAAYINDQVAALAAGSYCADFGSGLLYVAAELPDARAAGAWLEQLRRAAIALDGYAVLLQAPADWQNGLDRRGYQPQAIDVMRALKERWDPRHILDDLFA